MDGMDWGMVGRQWMWGGLVGRSWVGHTLVLDVGDITAITVWVSLVVDNLGAAIWESHSVRSSGHFGVRSLLLGKVCTRVGVRNTVLKRVRFEALVIWS